MKTDLFDFELPKELIAQHPVEPRDAARLLLVGARLEDRLVRELPAILSPDDLLVFNDTKVIAARLVGRRGAAHVEVTLHKPCGSEAAGALPATWRAFARPAKKLRPGDRLVFAPGFEAEVADKGEAGEVTLQLDRAGPDLGEALARHGQMPLPPYIRRDGQGDAHDRADYQTIYARAEGAVAAPTAGLHFTGTLLEALAARGIESLFVTLHVGAGTFLPVKTEDASTHPMHSERGILTQAAADRINAARAAGRRIVAVGTTSLRLLEAAAAEDGRLEAFDGDIDLFILPGYRFKLVDRLLTNFHLPRSTLFMLVAAFAGLERMQSAYAHARAERYRFYSYGDACLLEREATS